MTVTNEIRPLEIDGKDTTVGEKRLLVVRNHWANGDLVHLVFEGKDLLVDARSLECAIANARNHR